MPAFGRFRYVEAVPAADRRPRGALLLIHAFPLSALMWQAQLPLKAEGWHVIAPHLRGFGGGAADPPVSSMNDYAADLIDLLDGLHIHEAVVCGLSLGGYVAFNLLKNAPHYVKALILADTRAEADSPEASEGRTRMLEVLHREGPAGVATQMIPKLLSPHAVDSRPDLVARVRQLIMENDSSAIKAAIQAMMAREDSTGILGTLRIPVLVLVGEHDRLTPPEVAEHLQKRIPGALRAVVPGAGHLSNLEQPTHFNSAVADFLDRRV
jgi:pimeloyl-ACP methyl ester carboxylesterase